MKWSPTLGQNLLLVAAVTPIVAATYGWVADDGAAEIVHRAFMLWLICSAVAYLEHWGWCPSSGWFEIPAKIAWFAVLLFAFMVFQVIFKALLSWP